MTTRISKWVSGGHRVISSFRPPSPWDYTSPIKCRYCEGTCSLELPSALALISLWSTDSCQVPNVRGCFWPGWPTCISTRWKVPCALTNLRTHDGPNISFSLLCWRKKVHNCVHILLFHHVSSCTWLSASLYEQRGRTLLLLLISC